MKTIITDELEVKRVDNPTAERLVRNGVATYCPKSEWKKTLPKQEAEKGNRRAS